MYSSLADTVGCIPDTVWPSGSNARVSSMCNKCTHRRYIIDRNIYTCVLALGVPYAYVLLNKNTFIWVKINDDIYFIEKYGSRYAIEHGYASITMSNFSGDFDFFNADNLLDFKRQFKYLIRDVRGYAVVQSGIKTYTHPIDDIPEIALTEGLSNSKVFKILISALPSEHFFLIFNKNCFVK